MYCAASEQYSTVQCAHINFQLSATAANLRGETGNTRMSVAVLCFGFDFRALDN